MENLVFRLRFDCDNAAFEDNGIGSEIGRILRELASRIERGEATGLHQNVKDQNGNIVGTFRLANEGPNNA